MLGVAAPVRVDLARLFEALERVLPQRLEELVARGAVGSRLGHQHRLGHQLAERVEHVEAPDGLVGDHRLRGRGVERPDERPEAVEHRAFHVTQERVRPVDGGAQRLVALDGSAAAPGEEPEPLVEQRRDLGGLEAGDAGGGELDGERDAVEPAADLHHGRRVGLVDVKRRCDGRGPFGEQRGRVRRQRRRGRRRLGNRERADGPQLLAVDAEPLPAGRQHAHVLAAAEDRVGEVGGDVEHMLAVVEHDQAVASAEVIEDAVERRHAGPRNHAERTRHDLEDRFLRVRGGELAQPHTVAGIRQHLGRDAQREARLPDTADAGERHESVRAHEGGHCLDLVVAPDEARQLRRQVGGIRVERSQRLEVGGKTRRVDLVHALDVREVPQAVLAQVPQLRVVRESSLRAPAVRSPRTPRSGRRAPTP